MLFLRDGLRDRGEGRVGGWGFLECGGEFGFNMSGFKREYKVPKSIITYIMTEWYKAYLSVCN